MSQSGTTNNQYQFAGEQLDGAIGDYYLRQRFYDTSSGRFNRQDVFEGYRSTPISMHKYLYANANPITFTDPSGFTSMSELAAIQNMLSTSIRIGNTFLNVLDKVNSTVSIIQAIQTAFNLSSNPAAILPATLGSINLLALPILNDAMISLKANSGRIIQSIITRKLPAELKTFRKFIGSDKSAFAFYPPDIFPKGMLIPTGLKIQQHQVMIVTNNKSDRLFGMGMLLRPNKQDTSIQFFRMDYGAFNHTSGGDIKNHDVWQDGQFHYHIPRN